MSNTNNDYGYDPKKNCPIADSELCEWLGKKGCRDCYVGGLKTQEQKEKALAHWKVTLSYLPDNIDDLHLSDECQFCKEEPPEKATGYATFEMAHPEPYAEKGLILGLGKKVRTPVGSLVTIQASIGDKCKKDLRMADILQIGTLLAFLVASFVLLTIPQIGEAMANWQAFMPYVFIVLMLLAGYFLGKNLAQNQIKKARKRTRVDLTEIQLVKQMLNLGWFFFNTGNDGVPKVFFHKQKQYEYLKRPCCQEAEEDETLDNINI